MDGGESAGATGVSLIGWQERAPERLGMLDWMRKGERE